MKAISRGKELALTSNSFAVKVQLRSGGFIAVVPNASLNSEAVLLHANIIFVLDNDTSLVFCECLQLQNQLVMTLEDLKSIWDLRRGPDLLDEPELLVANLKRHLADDFKYFLVPSTNGQHTNAKSNFLAGCFSVRSAWQPNSFQRSRSIHDV